MQLVRQQSRGVVQRLLLVPLATFAIAAHAEQTSLGEFQKTFKIEDLNSYSSIDFYKSRLPSDATVDYEFYVPESYDDAEPAGVLVYVSPLPSGKMPKRWQSWMDRYNLIGVGANRSGNRADPELRIDHAILAVAAADESYEINPDRIYLTGFSGGSLIASKMAPVYPNIFDGGIFICGAEYWGDDEPPLLSDIQQNAYVFITGTYDQALEPTKIAYRGFKRSGVKNSKLMVIRGMGHNNAYKEDFREAVRYLDKRLQVSP